MCEHTVKVHSAFIGWSECGYFREGDIIRDQSYCVVLAMSRVSNLKTIDVVY